MSEARFENVMRELRTGAPPAPERLRDRVRALPAPRAQRTLRLRPALAAAVVIALATGIGAAAIGGLTKSRSSEQRVVVGGSAGAERFAPATPSNSYYGGSSARSSDSDLRSPKAWSAQTDTLAPNLKSRRLQRYDVSMGLRVRDLSAATQDAVRQTRKLGGYVAGANYATGGDRGDSSLDLRVPVQNVQRAIASFTELGTILSQRISVDDLQAPLDRLDQRLVAAQKVIAELGAKSFRTPDEQARLDAAKRTVKNLSRSRTNLVRAGTYATVSLQLTSRKAAAKLVQPGRFDRFWSDAGDILGKEAIAVLYALVVAGPFALLALLALFGERMRRRRADHRLLEETG